MSWLERAWHDLKFWLAAIPYAAKKTWRRFTHLAEDLAVLGLGFAIAFTTSGSNEVTRDRAVDGVVGAGLAFGLWLTLVFVWNLVLSYPRKNWNLRLALSEAESNVKRLRYQRDFYKDADRKRLLAAARLLKTELRDVQEKVELIDATVAGHTYWDGFAFPAGEWQKYRELIASDPNLYGTIEKAYVKANRANEMIYQRRTRAGAGKLIGRAEEEDLPGVSAVAGEAIDALDALMAETDGGLASNESSNESV